MRQQILQLLKFSFVAFIILGVPLSTIAQNADQKFNLSIYGSALSYKGEQQHQFWPNKKFSDAYLEPRLNWGGGIGLNKYLSPSFDAGFHLTYNKVKASNPNEFFEADLGSAMLGLRLKAYGTLLKEDAFIGPYLSLYGGGVYANSAGNAAPAAGMPVVPYTEKFVSLAGMTGAGIRFRFTDNINAFVESTWMVTDSDKIDGRDQGNWEQYLRHNFGLGFNLGKAKDTDGDGVPDRKDKCPDTPAGVQVDENGCPVDTDGDSVPDYQDQCPTEAGIADLGGCPDRDGDGVADKDDACPEEAGTAATNGCPDSDGDGIADKDDKCPETPAGTEIDADGCPVKVEPVAIDERTSKLLEEKVRFAFGSADLTDQFKLYLDSVAVALNKYPEHTLYINGHTDHIGSEQFNQKLSEQRAQAVKDYLITTGVENPDRLIIQGFGETRPLIKVNERLSLRRTAQERARNRRVEFEKGNSYNTR